MQNVYVLQRCREGASPAPSLDTFVMMGFSSETDCEFYWGLTLRSKYQLEDVPFHVMGINDYLDKFGKRGRLSDHRGYARVITKHPGNKFTGSELYPMTAAIVTRDVTMINVMDCGVDNCGYPTQRLATIKPSNDLIIEKLLLGKRDVGEYTHIAATDMNTGLIVDTAKSSLSSLIVFSEQKFKDLCFMVVYHDCRLSVIKETERLLWGHDHVSVSILPGGELHQIMVEDVTITSDLIGFDEYPIGESEENTNGN